MTPKEKAVELVGKFKDYVNPYIGSGMLSNTFDDDAILYQSKKCALVTIDEIINTDMLNDNEVYIETVSYLNYWIDVKEEIKKL